MTDVVTRYRDRTFSARAAHSWSVPTKAIESTSVDIALVHDPSGVGWFLTKTWLSGTRSPCTSTR